MSRSFLITCIHVHVPVCLCVCVSARRVEGGGRRWNTTNRLAFVYDCVACVWSCEFLGETGASFFIIFLSSILVGFLLFCEFIVRAVTETLILWKCTSYHSYPAPPQRNHSQNLMILVFPPTWHQPSLSLQEPAHILAFFFFFCFSHPHTHTLKRFIHPPHTICLDIS